MIFKSHHAFCTLLVIWLAIVGPVASQAAVPQLLNHQGRVAVNGVNFQGSGQFKFALVNADGSVTYWSNDGTSSAGSPPTLAVTLPVTKGLYAVLLGDTTLANMANFVRNAQGEGLVRSDIDAETAVWFMAANPVGAVLVCAAFPELSLEDVTTFYTTAMEVMRTQPA